MASIDESYTDGDSEYGSISTKNFKDIQDRSQIHPKLNARNVRLKISDCIKQAQNECKGSELLANIKAKGFHKVFKAVVNELKIYISYFGRIRLITFTLHSITDFFRNQKITNIFQKGSVESKFKRYNFFNQQSGFSKWTTQRRYMQ